MLSEKSTWQKLYSVALLCGIGFTVKLFIGTLAFEQLDEAFLNSLLIGVLIG